MKLNSIKNAGLECGLCNFTKNKLALVHNIPYEKADYFVRTLVEKNKLGDRHLHNSAAQSVANLVDHLAKTPGRVKYFVNLYCKKAFSK